MWTDEQLRVLIDSRKDYNEKYYDLVGNGKRNFWKQVSTKINLQFGTSYSGAHCMEKFESLKRDHKRMKDYIDGKDKGKKTKNVSKYDRLREQNIARRNQSPPPPYEESSGSISQPQL
ncbi:hypothetical protein C1645_830600 [Glomus cerebriforme]|uniref:Myb/SANT-like DNA-binding domain-containing protein n=1 Tax=Glomus cerebriforme TaxID=658196 RepID=A0A397SHQ6_9GLOM|nr:hypothetical protein C1645_830600 [Glomus cerebriforme]